MSVHNHSFICDERAHLFRSKFIDLFSDLEAWTLATWPRLNAAATAKGKAPPHFGDRIKGIEGLLKSEPGLFRTPSDLRMVLKRLPPYARMRTTLVHGRIEQGQKAGGDAIYLIDNVLGQNALAFASRVTLEAQELDTILRDLTEIVRQVRSSGDLT